MHENVSLSSLTILNLFKQFKIMNLAHKKKLLSSVKLSFYVFHKNTFIKKFGKKKFFFNLNVGLIPFKNP